MGICWYCHWGWPKPVADIYREALREVGGDEMLLEYGPAHIVWSDENFEDENINFCIAECDRWLADEGDLPEERGFTPEIVQVIRRSLVRLKDVPEEIRLCAPLAYSADDDHPERYPPPEGLEMVKDRRLSNV